MAVEGQILHLTILTERFYSVIIEILIEAGRSLDVLIEIIFKGMGIIDVIIAVHVLRLRLLLELHHHFRLNPLSRLLANPNLSVFHLQSQQLCRLLGRRCRRLDRPVFRHSLLRRLLASLV